MIRKIPFINRKKELESIRREINKDSFSLIVVYGRRRIGKTRLIHEALKKYEHKIFFTAAHLSYPLLSKEFSSLVGRLYGLYVPSEDIISALETLVSRNEKWIVVIDEFQYLVDADPSFTSRLQRSIDNVLSMSQLKLVLSGSAVSFFQKEFLAYKSPLYGRRTRCYRLPPLSFGEAVGFMKKMNVFDMVRTYSVLGGTPAYLVYSLDKKNLHEVLMDYFDEGSPLLDEALGLLKQEVREPRLYASIMKAVAEGYNKPAEIAGYIGVDARTLYIYTEVLKEMDILETITPLGRKRGSIIKFKDPFFNFYFRYTITLSSLIEHGEKELLIDSIMKGIDEYTAQVFEDIVKQLIPELYRELSLDHRPLEKGKWWHKKLEIDLITREPGVATVFIEVKWRDMRVIDAVKELRKLYNKSLKTGLLSRKNHYIIVTRKIVDNPQHTTVVKTDYGDIVDFQQLVNKRILRKT